ncbi:hypothetical protein OC25_02640 [Pedobacter kyungheensis]|uniref:Uncharacterized protein n=1 Tax=Pedobacter kyungheensis TaxID=1069985 RepID=A0A0C1FXV1_9SPHI|nr:hypothetical protein [Pedobacter kyungheensis]KIA96638.1 hypothetical protein OC25_02640 [Pedobacter kyungheensis]
MKKQILFATLGVCSLMFFAFRPVSKVAILKNGNTSVSKMKISPEDLKKIQALDSKGVESYISFKQTSAWDVLTTEFWVISDNSSVDKSALKTKKALDAIINEYK